MVCPLANNRVGFTATVAAIGNAVSTASGAAAVNRKELKPAALPARSLTPCTTIV